jgi:chromosome segregation ATPase
VLGLSESITNDRRSANITMRVPASRFDDAVAALKKLSGEVLSSSVDAKDVTDQLVDLDARLTALRAEESRYLQLFASAKTVDEMLKVQVALSQLRQQIEQLAAQQKTTKDRVAYSTISLSVASTAEPVPGPQAKWDPSRTFATAIAAFATFLRFFADFAIWAMVFGGIPLLILASLLVATRARRRAPAA